MMQEIKEDEMIEIGFYLNGRLILNISKKVKHVFFCSDNTAICLFLEDDSRILMDNRSERGAACRYFPNLKAGFPITVQKAGDSSSDDKAAACGG